MPSDSEIRELQLANPGLRVWGTRPGDSDPDPVRLGEFAVVPFDDVVAALRACEQRVYDSVPALQEYGWDKYNEGVRDERERIQSEALDAVALHVLSGEAGPGFLYRLDRILNPEGTHVTTEEKR